MQLVYHPAPWLAEWPKDAKPYVSRELCQQAHPEITAEEIVETPFVGGPEDFISELPKADLSEQEQEFVAENPGEVVAAVVPEPAPQAEPVVPSPESPEPAVKPAKKKK